MTRPAIFIDGEAGTTGLEIRTRLGGRADIELVSIDPDRRKDLAERKRLLNAVDLAILCLPDAAARESVSLIDNPTVRVLDASTAHRVHPDWAYGFPELLPGQADRIRTAKRVAVPGCYPTGAVALIRPLVDAGLLPAGHPVAVHAAEGYSGGGRALIDVYEDPGHAERDAFRIYGLELKHKHLPEMRVYGGLARNPLFMPAVGAWYKGEIVQVPLHLWALSGQPTAAALHAALAERFAGQRHVRVMPLGPAPARLPAERLNGTNDMELYVFENADEGQAVLVAVLDNLGKGASGAAVQNLELMLGLQPANALGRAAE